MGTGETDKGSGAKGNGGAQTGRTETGHEGALRGYCRFYRHANVCEALKL
jgi:hypothetical protein